MDSMRRPQVIIWYKVYCALLAITYLAVVAFGAFLVLARHKIADATNPPEAYLWIGLLCAVAGFVFAAPCAAALVLPPRPWVWVFHLVLICIGFTSACCVPFCVPLLIFWIRPETQAYFGRGKPQPSDV
jgi:hypothetical protein